MNKKYLVFNIILAVILLTVAFTGIVLAGEKNFKGYDAILEANLPQKETKVIELYSKKLNNNVYIQQKKEIGIDGWFLYEIKNNDKVIKEISYLPTSEVNQLVVDVNSDYFVIGSQYLFNIKTNELSNLGLYDEWPVNFYDSYNDCIAFITPNKDTPERDLLICVKDIKTNQVKIIDKFIIDDSSLSFYNAFLLAYDNKGNLYYDYYDKGIPKIMKYNIQGNKEVFLDKSCYPKISKDNIMASKNMNDYSKDSRYDNNLRLTNLNNNKKIIDELKTTGILFWGNNKVLLYNEVSSTYDVYKISDDKAELSNKIKVDFIPFDVIETNNEYEFIGYKYENGNFSFKNEKIKKS